MTYLSLAQNTRQKLIAKLNEFTGNTYTVKKGLVVLESTGKDSSSAATDFVTWSNKKWGLECIIDNKQGKLVEQEYWGNIS